MTVDDFTYVNRPTNRSAIEALEKIIGQYRRGMMTGQEALSEIGDTMAEHADATRSSIAEPSNPMWDCCKRNPAAIMRFDDGSAAVICAADKWHARPENLFPLPEHWAPHPEFD